jgi:hypothetical protein
MEIEGPFLPEERALAQRWLLQWSGAGWTHINRPWYLGRHGGTSRGPRSRILNSAPEGCVEASTPRTGCALRVRAHDCGPCPGIVASAASQIRAANLTCPIADKVPAAHHLDQDLTCLAEAGIEPRWESGDERRQPVHHLRPLCPLHRDGLPSGRALPGSPRTHQSYRQRWPRGGDAALHPVLGADVIVIRTNIVIDMGHEQVNRSLSG